MIETLLERSLGYDPAIDWADLKIPANYPTAKPEEPTPPKEPQVPEVPPEPKRPDPEYQVRLNFFERLFRFRHRKYEGRVEEQFIRDREKWQASEEEALARYASELEEYETILQVQAEEYGSALAQWEKERAEYLMGIDEKYAKYVACHPTAVLDYCDTVLGKSDYPDCFPQNHDLSYNPANKCLVVDYQLPPPNSLPTLREVRYIQSRDEFAEKHISQAQFNRLYDNLLYQVALRTVHELCKADRVDAISIIVLNGHVHSIDPGTGHEINACILSLQVSKAEVEHINLAHVEPKVCFKRLKGVGSSRLHSLTPVAPIVRIDRDDARFISSYAVADGLHEGYNVAAMDWQDFEHLVRELFEKEFTASGGEVRVTHASRDGGVDAVAFDPDPIRGGKIVIQAKRYTNTVGVAAVRDLYGTVVNEGANKGILITTSDYGPDAYGFARGKPLTLLSGSNLLHLLQIHGYKARIDLKEAKRILAEEN